MALPGAQCDEATIMDENKSGSSESFSMDTTLIPYDCSSTKNPLLNSVVIKCVFQHLNLDDIKNLRSVCQEWNSVAHPLLRKRATIVFKKNDRGPKQFLRTSGLSNSNLPFTTFRFSEECIVEEAVHLFIKYGAHIKSLKFDDVNFIIPELSDPNSPALKLMSSQLWIQCNNLSELRIDCSSRGTKHMLFIDQLKTVKILQLGNCDLHLKKDVKIAPSVICLNRVNFFRDLENPTPVCAINDAFEFHNATEIYINQFKSNAVFLDVGKDVANIERMKLTLTVVKSWEKSQWSVDKLCLCRTLLSGKTTMRIKELKITDDSGVKFPAHIRNAVEFSYLPVSLENLLILNEKETQFVCSGSINLPNLKTLTIVRPEVLTHFVKCPNLVKVSLVGNLFRYPNQPPRILDLGSLPQSLQALEIVNYDEIIDTRSNAGEPLRMKTLILHPPSFSKRDEILRSIQPDVFVLWMNNWIYKFRDITHFVKENPQLKRILLRFESYKQNVPLQSVTTTTHFHVIENTEGRNISRLEFEALLTI